VEKSTGGFVCPHHNPCREKKTILGATSRKEKSAIEPKLDGALAFLGN
jgi:hypothetical protein